jgi:AraC family transcriptional regulator
MTRTPDEVRVEWPQVTVRTARDPLAREPFRIDSRPLHHVWMLVEGAPTVLKRDLGQQRWSAVRMKPGDIHMCCAGEPDFEFGWTSVAGAVAPEFAQVFLEQSLVDRVACEHGAYRRGFELPSAVGLHDPLVTEILLELCRCARNPSHTDALFVDAVAELLAAHLLRRYCQERKVQRRSGERPLSLAMVSRIKEFVDHSLTRPLRVTELAALAGQSVAHFTRAFRLATGETPHAFTLRLRIERTEQLLRRGNLGLAEIAAATGFSSQSHFTTQYRRARGLTPGEYRRQMRR